MWQPRRPLFLIISLLVAAGCIRLGFWQLSKFHLRRAANAVAYAERAAPPVLVPGPQGVSAQRRIVARGSYDPARDFVIRGREYHDAHGIELVTPLRVEGTDTALLVLRGFVPAGDGLTARPDTLREPAPQVIRGVTFALDHAADGGDRRAAGGTETWRRIDAAMAATLPYPVYPVFVMQGDDSTLPRWPRRLDPPVLDEGPYESYAIQWFAFAVIFGGGGIIWMAKKRGGGEEENVVP